MKIIKGLSKEGANSVIEWTNKEDESFLIMWSGKKWTFPLTHEQLKPCVKDMFSIYEDDEFIGVIQIIERQEHNIHIGRFLLNPSKRGLGIGTKALGQFCTYLFDEYNINTISLNVYENNKSATKCYEKCDFQVFHKIEENQDTRLFMVLMR